MEYIPPGRCHMWFWEWSTVGWPHTCMGIPITGPPAAI